MRWRCLVGSCVCLAFVGACGNNGSPAPGAGAAAAPAAAGARARGAAVIDPADLEGDHSLPGDPVAGAAIYARICIACHAADGRGNGGLTGANFVNDRTRLTKNNNALLRSIRNGVNRGPVAMPSQRGALSDQDMKNALSYIRKTFGGTQH